MVDMYGKLAYIDARDTSIRRPGIFWVDLTKAFNRSMGLYPEDDPTARGPFRAGDRVACGKYRARVAEAYGLKLAIEDHAAYDDQRWFDADECSAEKE